MFQAHDGSCESHLAWEPLHNPCLVMHCSYSARRTGFLREETSLHLHVGWSCQHNNGPDRYLITTLASKKKQQLWLVTC